MLPFTRAEFFEVFARYNAGVWPVQLAAYGLGFAMVLALWRRSRAASRWIAGGLAAMWLWTGIGYHALYFARINPVALAFGALFAVHGVLLAAEAVRGQLCFGPPADGAGWLGLALAGYAALAYPLVGLLAGHQYPAMPTFGITPCPLVIFTFGMLLLARARVPRRLLAVPLVWSLIGGSAAFVLGVPQDAVLLLSGLSVLPMLRRERQRDRPQDRRVPAKVGR